jgi:hypothetical protein
MWILRGKRKTTVPELWGQRPSNRWTVAGRLGFVHELRRERPVNLFHVWGMWKTLIAWRADKSQLLSKSKQVIASEGSHAHLEIA